MAIYELISCKSIVYNKSKDELGIYLGAYSKVYGAKLVLIEIDNNYLRVYSKDDLEYIGEL